MRRKHEEQWSGSSFSYPARVNGSPRHHHVSFDAEFAFISLPERWLWGVYLKFWWGVHLPCGIYSNGSLVDELQHFAIALANGEETKTLCNTRRCYCPQGEGTADV
jgi:hypothetical protein